MTAPDAPQVEPLTLTLEEALARIGERGYMLAVYHRRGAPEYVLCDMYSAFARGSFGHWKDAVEAVLGVPVVARDDTAELVEAVDTFLSRLEGFLGATIADESVSLVARRQFERLHALLDDSLADAREALTLTPNETGFLVVEAWENGNRPNIPAYGAAAARLVTSGGKLRAALARYREARS